MGTVRLEELAKDQVVIHFGGALTSVDAYTFANSLLAFSEAVQSINSAINPGQNIEIRLQAVGPGSFRAVLKSIPKGIGGFFSTGVNSILWSLLATIIYDKIIEHDPTVTINIIGSDVEFHACGDKIVIDKKIYDHVQELRKSYNVDKPLSKAFKVIESDEAIENFGMTSSLSDVDPIVQVGREQFPRLSSGRKAVTTEDGRRDRSDVARLIILKAWFTGENKKWSFEWNGVPISAPIQDVEFLEKLVRREVSIRAGDALDAEITYEQYYNEKMQTWVNDNGTYVVAKVFKRISSDGEQISFDA